MPAYQSEITLAHLIFQFTLSENAEKNSLLHNATKLGITRFITRSILNRLSH